MNRVFHVLCHISAQTTCAQESAPTIQMDHIPKDSKTEHSKVFFGDCLTFLCFFFGFQLCYAAPFFRFSSPSLARFVADFGAWVKSSSGDGIGLSDVSEATSEAASKASWGRLP